MKRALTFLIFLFIACCIYAQGKWEARTSFPPGPRERAFHFTIDDKMYIGAGRSHRGYGNFFQINEEDVWSYEFASDTWEQLNPFPGGPFRNGASFVIDGFGYVLTGHDNNSDLDFFWKYDPATDSWEQLPDFPGGIRSFPIAFSIGGKGYVGLGGDGTASPPIIYQDLWEYDPATESWTEQSGFPGQERWRAFSFVIDGKAYVGGGTIEGQNGVNFRDTYRYDPVEDSWTPVADFPEGWGIAGFAHAIEGRGYVAEGARNSAAENYGTRIWEYNPTEDNWAHITNMPGSQLGRIEAFSAVHEGKLYFGGGRNYTSASFYIPLFDDFHVWDKDAMVEAPEHEHWNGLGRGEVDSTFISIHAIAAVEEGHIWALPTATYTVSEAPLEAMATSDGGNNWQAYLIDTTRGYTSAALFAHDSQMAWVMGSLAEEQTMVYQTIDGGQSWTLKLEGADNLIEESMGIHFFDENNGLCWGNDWSNARIVIYRTTDGGGSWQIVEAPNLPGAGSWLVNYSASGNNMYDAVGDTIWIPTDTQVARSTDRGATWTSSTAAGAFTTSMYSIAFENAQRGMVTSDNYPNTLFSRAFVTEDGGATWTEISMPEIPLAVTIEHIPGSPGAYVAHSTYFPSTKMVYTPNFGQDWFVLEAPPVLNCLQFLSKEAGFGGGPLLRSAADGVYSWQGDFDAIVTSTETSFVVETAPYQFFPVPAGEKLTIYNVKGKRIESIYLFDALGQQVKQRDLGHRTEIVEISLEQLPSGIYFLKIKDDSDGFAAEVLKQ